MTTRYIDQNGDHYVDEAGANYNATPTTSVYDFRPFLSGSTESVTVNASSSPVLVKPGRYYIGVRGYTAAAYTLKAHFHGETARAGLGVFGGVDH